VSTAGAASPVAQPVSVPVAERRVTSVLFADLVSYTTLSESRDTEDVRSLLSAYFDVCTTVVRRYGGTVEKFIGDAVMAVWGVPTAHEDDAERSVRAGLELLTSVTALGEKVAVPELALRVGIVTGEVAANLGATDQGMVAGDPVNTAARVQAAAGPGEVWVDETTRALTAAAVSYADAGEHTLKGKSEPVRLFRAGAVVAAVGGVQRIDGLEAPLVGRDRELRLLKELFHATEESGRSQLVVLDGEAGVGKSRLGWEFEKYVDGLRGTVRWHRGRCLSYGDGVAFWALIEAVRGRLGLVENDSGPVALSALERILDEYVADESERSWLKPRIASLLGEEAREFTREDLFAAWTRFFDRLGGGDPVVLLVDDAQYVDDGLADYLEHLVANATTGCFVLLLARPELLASRPQLGGRRATPIRVEPLARTNMVELVDGLVHGLPDEVRSGLADRAEGIPLYAVETVRALIDRDLVVPLDGRYVVADSAVVDLATIGAPASLHALIAARLDALDPAERRVLTDASVLGESFTREGIGILAAHVTGLDDVLSRLQRRELIATEVDQFSAERGQYHFVQTVVRQVAYSTLSRHDRKARHLQVAEHLAVDTDRADELAQVIARHLLDAADAAGADDPDVPELHARAGGLMVRAGERAGSLGAYADAVRCYDVALSCLDDPGIRARTLVLQAAALYLLNRFDATAEVAVDAAALFDAIGDKVGGGEAGYRHSRALMQLSRWDEALAVATTRRSSLDGVEGVPGVERAKGRLASQVATVLVFNGRHQEAVEPLMEALHLADLTDDPETFRRACNSLAVYLERVGSIRVAGMLLDGMAALAREQEDWLSLTLALGNHAAQDSVTDLPGAIRLTEETVAVHRAHGLAVDDSAHFNLIAHCWLAGDWDRVTEVVAASQETPSERKLAEAVAVATASLCTLAGRSVEALPIEFETEGGDRQVHLFAMGVSALLDGDLHRAVPALRDCVAQEMTVSLLADDMHYYWPVAMRTALAAEDDEAVDDLWRIGAQAEQTLAGTTSLVGHARVFRALQELRRPDPDLASVEADLMEGIAILGRTGNVVWRAHAEEDLGRFLLAHGRAEDAAPYLKAARDVYERLGATTWLARLGQPAGLT
jgi:class 3 adenylate cyclase/tetratricopeptide (TPR) repeat protein